MADSSSTIQKTGLTNATKTSRGTRIVNPGEGLDKDAFLRILSAELSHQDPSNAKDSTEFVAQMAQFAGLEQMANLNNNMRFIGASSLIGKSVMLNRISDNGNLYVGKVTGISKDGDLITINVAVGEEKDKDGNTVPIIKKFRMEDVIELVNGQEDIKDIPKEDEKDNDTKTESEKPEGENPKGNEENKDVQV